ncbi:hypothetical protein GO755_23785 [Spirosoma sp. HMF4905]|uniref:Uncharacterized protein n=1 Tax=Spirosoma arboris TaxID=2682092 RepID=A0A7K1SH47_9BACT|nr:hypothetical protein [Spirosoma arboris]MVM33083.1 hypothetical protein [Spirosoma arboris]
MKSVFPYVIMVVLFVAGTRLVNRQQNYFRSIQESASSKPASFTSMLATNEPTDVAGNQPGSVKSTNTKKPSSSLVR